MDACGSTARRAPHGIRYERRAANHRPGTTHRYHLRAATEFCMVSGRGRIKIRGDYSRENLPPDTSDWARVEAMTDEEVVAAALSDPDAQPLTPEQLARMRRVSRVKVIRERLGLTQSEFAEAFRLPITTLRDWEQHRSTPDAPARALLLAIERDPEVMRRLLAETAA